MVCSEARNAGTRFRLKSVVGEAERASADKGDGVSDMDKRKKYRLYAMPVNAKSVDMAQNERFSRATAWYVLIYTDSDTAPENSVEIDENEVNRLSSADRDWLLECNMELIVEDAKAREKEIAQSIGEKIKQLEIALESAKNGGTNNA